MRNPRRAPRAALAVCLAALAGVAGPTIASRAARASEAAARPPVPPCAGDGPTAPAFAPEGPVPAVSLWRAGELPAGWAPPACAGWEARDVEGATVFALAGRFRHPGDADSLLVRVGALSKQTELRFWNAGKGRWTQMYKRSEALSGPDPSATRPDFAAEEMTAGTRLRFVQDDPDPLGPVVQGMTVRERAADRLVITTRNESPAKFYGVPVLAAGGLEAYFQVERDAGDVWRYYALTRVRLLVPDTMAPPPEDYVNQGVSLFRFLASMPTDAGPPALPEAAVRQAAPPPDAPDRG